MWLARPEPRFQLAVFHREGSRRRKTKNKKRRAPGALWKRRSQSIAFRKKISSEEPVVCCGLSIDVSRQSKGARTEAGRVLLSRCASIITEKRRTRVTRSGRMGCYAG